VHAAAAGLAVTAARSITRVPVVTAARNGCVMAARCSTTARTKFAAPATANARVVAKSVHVAFELYRAVFNCF